MIFVIQNILMIQITNYKGFLIEILKAIIKLCIAGFLIGFLKSYDAIIAIILFLKILHVIYKNIITAETKNWILLIGMIVTGFGGMVGEKWGVSNNYWKYHEVARELPLWLPLLGCWLFTSYIE